MVNKVAASIANRVDLRALNSSGGVTDSSVIADIDRAVALRFQFKIRVSHLLLRVLLGLLLGLLLGRPVKES